MHGHGLRQLPQPPAGGVAGGHHVAGVYVQRRGIKFCHLLQRLGLRVTVAAQHGVGHGIRTAGQPAQAFRAAFYWARRRFAFGHVQDALQPSRQAPGLGDTAAQFVQAQAQHAAGGGFTVVLAGRAGFAALDRLTYLHRFFGQIALGQQTTQVLEHRAQKRFFAFARHRRPLIGQRAGHQRAQEFFLQQGRVGLVAHVFQQHHRQGHVAYAGKPHQGHRTRHRGHTTARHRAEVRRVDHAQQLVGQRHVIEDLVRQVLQAFGL